MVRLSAKPSKRVILIAGIDYPPRGSGGPILEKKCNSRVRIVLAKEQKRIKHNLPARKIRFTLFDIRNGIISTNDNGAMNSNGTYKWVKNMQWGEFHTLMFNDYKGGSFPKDRAGEFISITTVYKFMQSVGYHDPGSIIELSIFGHGYVGGPVLVNSSDSLGPNHAERDRSDNDPRPWKDFKPPNMKIAELGWLRRAFDNNGYTWIWGCNKPHPYTIVLNQLLISPTYKNGSPHNDTNHVEDTDTFSFTIEDVHDYHLCHSVDSQFFPGNPQSHVYPFTFQKDFVQVKNFFKRGISKNGRKYFAEGTGKKVYGAPLGIETEFNDPNDPLQKIPLGPPSTSNFTPHLKFYERYIGVQFDDEGRHFCVYDP